MPERPHWWDTDGLGHVVGIPRRRASDVGEPVRSKITRSVLQKIHEDTLDVPPAVPRLRPGPKPKPMPLCAAGCGQAVKTRRRRCCSFRCARKINKANGMISCRKHWQRKDIQPQEVA